MSYQPFVFREITLPSWRTPGQQRVTSECAEIVEGNQYLFRHRTRWYLGVAQRLKEGGWRIWAHHMGVQIDFLDELYEATVVEREDLA
jgi:hypothetical protein